LGELAQLLKSEQLYLTRKWCPGFRRGTGILNPQDESTAYKWELIERQQSDEYRLKRDTDGTEMRLVLLSAKWYLFSGDDYSHLIAKGNISKP
jgi:hypothetical protein